MEFERYSERILPSLSDFVQRAFPLNEISVRTLRRCTLEDPNFLPNDLIVARSGREIRGAALGAKFRKYPTDKLGNKTGYLKMICAVPFDESLMQSLLEKTEERLKDEGCDKIACFNFGSWYLFPGVNLRYEDLLDFLSNAGFKKTGECVDYVLDMSAYRMPRRIKRLEERLVDNGMVFTLVNPTDRERLRDWVLEKFGSGWSYEAERAIGRAGAGVWVAEDATGTIAFSVFGSLENHWFGPIGVVEEKRKMGVGSVMLFKALDSLANLGIPKVIIPWTGHLFFYTQIPGIVGIRHYWMMTKDL